MTTIILLLVACGFRTSTEKVRVGETLAAPLSSSETLQGGVLRLKLCDEFLVALTTRAEILVWSLAGGDLGHVLLSYSHTLATHQLKREGPGAGDDTVPFRPWNRDGPVNKSGRTVAISEDASGHFTQGDLSLHRCAGGGLLLAAAASASDSIAPATALLCQRGNSGDIWHAVDLHPEALPLEQGSLLAVCMEGALLHAGFCGGPGEGGPRRPAVVAASLPSAAQGRLQASAPCPAYHPDTLIWLLRNGQAALARRILQSFMWTEVRMWLLLFLAVAVGSHGSHAGTASEFVRKQAPRRGLVSVAVSPQGVLQLEDDSGTGRHSEDVVTDPTFAESAGKWKVHYDGWSRNHKFEDVEIFCDGAFKLWNGHTTKLSTSEDDKKALCNRGAMKNKIQWVNKDWAGDNRKWECGWYDSKADKIHVYHYVKGHRSTKDGHRAGDDFWGKIDRSKREAEVNCPTTAPPEGKSGTSARWTAGATALSAFLVLRQNASPHGIPPLVDLDFMEFHCADAVARCERMSSSAPASSSQLHADGLDVGSGATAASLFEDDFEARMAKLRSSWAEDDPSPSVPTQENGETTSAGWHVSELELDELGRFLQTRTLPMVSSHEQADSAAVSSKTAVLRRCCQSCGTCMDNRQCTRREKGTWPSKQVDCIPRLPSMVSGGITGLGGRETPGRGEGPAKADDASRWPVLAILAAGTVVTAVPIVRWYMRRRKTAAFEYGPVELSQMTLAAAKELHQKGDVSLQQKRTSLVPDALLDLEEQAEEMASSLAPGAEVDVRAKALQAVGAPPFKRFLRERRVPDLVRSKCHTLQLNIGLYCNQACNHCHVESSPLRKEMMSKEVVERCLLLLKNSPTVKVLDITGGAPELNRGFRRLVEGAAQLRETGERPDLRIIDRCNLTVLLEPGQESLPAFLVDTGVDIIASLPSYEPDQTDRQRGRKVFERSIQGLRILNQHGYGSGKGGRRLDLVFNPPGPFLPPRQQQLEMKYKTELETSYGVKFDGLLTIANMPIKRYFDYLRKKGALEGYMDLLVRNFNEDTVPDLMCTNTVNVGWDGKLYDCDFNQQLELGLGGGLSVFDVESLDDPKLQRAGILTAAHCYGCTAALEPFLARTGHVLREAQLLVLLWDVGATPHASDLDECGQRFMKAFEIHAAVRRWHLRTPNSEAFLQHLSSEDLCWALHSDCQGTLVDRILEVLGHDLDWPALRHVGLGLWLRDLQALKKVLEQLPRALLRRQSAPDKEIQPEAVALWYALMGRRTLLAAEPEVQTQSLVEMCLGAVNADGSLLCNCHVQANGPKVEAVVAEQTAKATEALVDELLRTAVAATAEAPNRAVKRRVRQRLHKKLGAVLNKQEFEVAMERFHAAAEAQRVRQDEAARPQRRGPVNRAPVSAPIGAAPARPPQASPSQVVAVPVWMVGAPVAGPAPAGRMGQVQMPQMPQMPQQMQPRWNCGIPVCAVQDVRQFQEQVRVPEMTSAQAKVPYMNQTYMEPQEDLDLGVNQTFRFQRAMSEGAGCDHVQTVQNAGPAANLPVQRTFIQFSSQDGSQRRSRSQ
ncbi:DMXL1 [Symbiodinium sp. KB8]|nr:DMXL1 [Symbiodinium sp. KB8]